MDDKSGESMKPMENWVRQNWTDWCTVDGGKPGVGSKDEGKHRPTGRNYLLFVEKMMWVDERVRPKMKSECCEEAEL